MANSEGHPARLFDMHWNHVPKVVVNGSVFGGSCDGIDVRGKISLFPRSIFVCIISPTEGLVGDRFVSGMCPISYMNDDGSATKHAIDVAKTLLLEIWKTYVVVMDNLESLRMLAPAYKVRQAILDSRIEALRQKKHELKVCLKSGQMCQREYQRLLHETKIKKDEAESEKDYLFSEVFKVHELTGGSGNDDVNAYLILEKLGVL